jgi:hypothetical protein
VIRPSGGGGTRGSQDPFAEWHDEADFLREGNERGR